MKELIKKDKVFDPKQLWKLIFLPLALIITAVARMNPELCERYATGVYAFMSGTVNHLMSMTDVSVSQIIIIVFAAVIVAYTIGTIVRLLISDQKLKRLLAYAVNLISIFSLVFFLFTVTCGINYSRPSFSETEGYEITGATRDELEGLYVKLVTELNEVCGEVSRDESGVFKTSFESFAAMGTEAAESFSTLGEHFKTLGGNYGAPKAVSFFGLMSATQITGFFFPFVCEANVNSTIPEMSLPYTMCHELAHLRGHMREDEANFIAYLCCKQSDSPDFVYSGLLLAYSVTASSLYSETPERYKELYAALDERVVSDLKYKSDYWTRYEGIIADVSDAVNDTYLKLNDQSDGVKSYGRMVDLLISEYRKG